LLNQNEFQRVLNAVVQLFSHDRRLLELRGSLIIRNLCTLLNAKSIYSLLADILQNKGLDQSSAQVPEASDLEFRSIMVQTLNLILLTARELDELRLMLRASLGTGASEESTALFVSIYGCWCHNPVATLALCLVAQAYDLASSLVMHFASVDVTIGFLMQVDKLVQLIESPIFIQLRLQLLEVGAPHHQPLLKSLYGLLMLLPQSTAFTTLSTRLSTVATLREHVQPGLIVDATKTETSSRQRDDLLEIFERVQSWHKSLKNKAVIDRSLNSGEQRNKHCNSLE